MSNSSNMHVVVVETGEKLQAYIFHNKADADKFMYSIAVAEWPEDTAIPNKQKDVVDSTQDSTTMDVEVFSARVMNTEQVEDRYEKAKKKVERHNARLTKMELAA